MIFAVIISLLLALCLAGPAEAQETANELVKTVINNELKEENADHSHWMLHVETHKPDGRKEVDEVVETQAGDLKFPLSINGQPPDERTRQAAEKQLRQEVQNPALVRKSERAQSEDETRSQRMLKMLPNAFLYSYGERRGDLVDLKFTPNPKFKPPNREAEVFHAMQGDLWVDSKQLRLEEISGRLMREVKFGGGFLGHLDKGGQFDVKQAQVAHGYWELTLLNVQMRGKALFFKTINVQQYTLRSDFKLLNNNLTVAQGADLLRNELKSHSEGKAANEAGNTMPSKK